MRVGSSLTGYRMMAPENYVKALEVLGTVGISCALIALLLLLLFAWMAGIYGDFWGD